MACYYPLRAWRPLDGGGRLVFDIRKGWADRPVSVPCGQCVGCRLERSRVWAVRCVHEASLHDENCFITLTYSDVNVPVGRTLVKGDFQKFLKRLRDRVGYGRVRYYACGEYGEQFGRPHYHACLFGYDFPDKVFFKFSPAGEKLFRSELLEDLWRVGHSSIGAVTFESAAYVARYIMSKRTGALAFEKYNDVDWSTGEIIAERIPEYTDMSRRPGIGRDWFKQFASDVFPDDFVVLNGKKFRPPRYYDNAFEVVCPGDFRRVKQRRIRRAAKHFENNTPDRLRVRELVHLAKIKSLKREL